MRITARTFGHLASNPTFEFANNGLTGLALALASFGAEAQHAAVGSGASGVGTAAPAPDTRAALPISSHVDHAQHARPCAFSEVPPPDAGPPAVERVAQRGNTITLWDEITPPAPVPNPTPLQQPMPVPVDAGRDAGAVSACALR